MNIFTFTLRDGVPESEMIDIEISIDGELNHKEISNLRCRLNRSVVEFDNFGAGWYCPETDDFWILEGGTVTEEYMKDQIKPSSDCCDAEVGGVSDNVGRCADCWEWCGLTYYIEE